MAFYLLPAWCAWCTAAVGGSDLWRDLRESPTPGWQILLAEALVYSLPFCALSVVAMVLGSFGWLAPQNALPTSAAEALRWIGLAALQAITSVSPSIWIGRGLQRAPCWR